MADTYCSMMSLVAAPAPKRQQSCEERLAAAMRGQIASSSVWQSMVLRGCFFAWKVTQNVDDPHSSDTSALQDVSVCGYKSWMLGCAAAVFDQMLP